MLRTTLARPGQDARRGSPADRRLSRQTMALSPYALDAVTEIIGTLALVKWPQWPFCCAVTQLDEGARQA